jgi:nicotinamidase-related amidase
MTEPTTFRRLVGLPTEPAALAQSVLVLIDCQREYVDGAVPVPGLAAALDRAQRLLERARERSVPVFHVAHRGAPGSPVFDPNGPFCDIMPAVAPRDGEAVVHKQTPNAFVGTDLGNLLSATARSQAIFTGFMTHNCVDASVRGAFDLGYACAVAADAVATRDLPDGRGGIIPADVLHRAALAGLADRVAIVVENVDGFV